MIRFEDWNIYPSGDIIARQYDNKTRVLSVVGDIPHGWEWVMIIQTGDYMDYLPLSPTDDGIEVELTSSHLSVAGHYDLQLRGTQGAKVRHTNITSAYIPESLAGDAKWPTVPSEFTELERRVNEKAEQVEGYSTHPPVIGENGNWYLWDGAQYVDSGYVAEPETDGTLSITGRPADAAAVGYDLKYHAQGMAGSFDIHSSGWKRVAILSRSNSGFAEICLRINNSEVGKTMQNVLIGYSGFISHPIFDVSNGVYSCDSYGHPRLWQMVSHTPGENVYTTEPDHVFRIDKVRLCYPKNRADVDLDSTTEEQETEYKNPLNIYLDVHVVCNDPDFDWTAIKPPPWGQLVLRTHVTAHAKSVDGVAALVEETTVEDENPTGLYGVVCEAYELELENDTQMKVPGYSKMEELAVNGLYQVNRVQYELNSGELIRGRKGSTRLVGLEVSKQGVPFYVRAICDNMVPLNTNESIASSGMRLTKHPNGIYVASGPASGPSSPTYVPLYQQFPNSGTKPPVVLKAGVRYVINDCWLHLISYEEYEAIRDGTDKMPYNSAMESYHGTASDRYNHGPTIIEAVDYDRVVAMVSVYFKGKTDYNGRCYYPQLCREDVGVINPALTSDDPVSLVTRRVAYSPKVTLMADHNDKSFYRIVGVDYANELRVFADGHPDLHGTAVLEIAVNADDRIIQLENDMGNIQSALDSIIEIQNSLIATSTIGDVESALNSIIEIQNNLISVEPALDSIIEIQNNLIGGDYE